MRAGFLTWPVFGVMCLTWGSVFLLQSLLLEYASPLLIGWLRACFAGTCMCLVTVVLCITNADTRQVAWRALNLHTLKKVATMSLGLDVVGNFLTIVGQQNLPSAVTSILHTLAPAVAGVAAHVLLKDSRLTRRAVAGMIVSSFGIGLTLLPGFLKDQPSYSVLAYITGAFFVLFATTGYGVGPVLVKFWDQRAVSKAGVTNRPLTQPFDRTRGSLKASLLTNGPRSDSADTPGSKLPPSPDFENQIERENAEEIVVAPIPPTMQAAGQYLCSVVFLTPLLALAETFKWFPRYGSDGFTTIHKLPVQAWLLALSLAILCNSVPLTCFYFNFSRLGPAKLSLSAYVLPVVALFWAITVKGEFKGLETGLILCELLGGVFSLYGTSLALMKRPPRERDISVQSRNKCDRVSGYMNRGAAFILTGSLAVALVAGLAELQNSTKPVIEAFVEGNYSFIDNGPWRPPLGVFGGQGCGPPITEQGAGCEDLAAGGAFPYFLFTPLTADPPLIGGQLIFEWRGYEMYIVPMLFGWLSLLPLWAVIRAVLRRAQTTTLCCWSSHCLRLRLGRVRSNKATHTGWCNVLASLSRAELLLSIWLAGFLALCLTYVHEHARINNLVGKFGRAVGGLVLGTLSVIILPVTRHSVILRTLGVPFERALKFHRGLGMLSWLGMGIHGLAMAISHAQVFHRGLVDTAFPRDHYLPGVPWGLAIKTGFLHLFTWDIGFPHGPPLAGFAAWGVATVMIGFALWRRDNWEWFLVAHMGYVLVFLLSFIHYPTLMLFCIPAILALLADMCLRYRPRQRATVFLLAHHSKASLTTLRVVPHEKFTRPTPGQFVTVQLQFAENQHHPFSVASLPEEDGSFLLHIKAMGLGTWTHRLALLSTDCTPSDPMYAKLDGPFGVLNPPLGAHKRVFMVASGVGITPYLHLLEACVANPTLITAGKATDCTLTLIWTIRYPHDLSPYLERLRATMQAWDAKQQQQQQQGGGSLNVHVILHVTRLDEEALHPLLLDPAEEIVLDEKQLMDKGSFVSSVTNVSEVDKAVTAREQEQTKDNGTRAAKREPDDGEKKAFSLADCVQAGRPTMDALLVCGEGERPSDVCVYVCGPPGLVTDVMGICHDRDFVCGPETFQF